MKNMYLILLLGLAVLMSGCTQQQPSGQVIKYVCTDGSVVADKSLCPVQAGVTETAKQPITLETELSVCSEMPSVQTAYQAVSLEDICMMGIAGKHKNASLCRKVSSDQRKGCYTFVAEVANNADLCLDAGAQKDQCYDQYARDLRDVSVCDKISDISYKDSCYSGLASTLGDPTLCDKIRNVNQKDSCYWSMASRFSDSSYCQKIANSNQKQNCLQNMQQMVPKEVIQKG